MVQHALGKPTALQSPDDAALASGPVPDFGQPAVLLHTQLHLDLVSCFARFRLLDLVAPVQLIRAAPRPAGIGWAHMRAADITCFRTRTVLLGNEAH
jgi:hypothetical protein